MTISSILRRIRVWESRGPQNKTFIWRACQGLHLYERKTPWAGEDRNYIATRDRTVCFIKIEIVAFFGNGSVKLKHLDNVIFRVLAFGIKVLQQILQFFFYKNSKHHIERVYDLHAISLFFLPDRLIRLMVCETRSYLYSFIHDLLCWVSLCCFKSKSKVLIYTE